MSITWYFKRSRWGNLKFYWGRTQKGISPRSLLEGQYLAILFLGRGYGNLSHWLLNNLDPPPQLKSIQFIGTVISANQPNWKSQATKPQLAKQWTSWEDHQQIALHAERWCIEPFLLEISNLINTFDHFFGILLPAFYFIFGDFSTFFFLSPPPYLSSRDSKNGTFCLFLIARMRSFMPFDSSFSFYFLRYFSAY